MVHIINGEIVADDDPRVVAKRGGGGGGGGGGASARPRQNAPPMQAAQAAHAGPPASPLDAIAGQLGIAGRTVQIPAISNRVPAREVPLIVILLISIAALFFGWQILAVMAVLHVISGISETSGAPQGQRAQPPPRPGTGR
jgi:hypothetical protein